MKKTILLVSLLVLSISSYSQVGINTTNPLGIFHIDNKGNTGVVPTAAQLTDDFVVKSDGKGGVGIGIGTMPADGASIDLGSSKKGLSLNMVALTGVDDKTTVPNPVRGMLVYNTTANAELYPGICLFNGTTQKWDQMAFTKETLSVNIAVSLYDVTTTPETASVISAGGYSGVAIPFAPLDSSTAGITITEDGTYSFALNMVGPVDLTMTQQTHLYLFMLRKSDMAIMDAAALATLSMYNPPLSIQSVTAILASELKAGDELEFLICHNEDTPRPWTLLGGAATTYERYNKTSMSYWKL